ncbi:MAG: VWA domain-containing protein [Pirellulaceae bacterium]|nr:VWA domain-containing protein [Planctomycetales bacterium]
MGNVTRKRASVRRGTIIVFMAVALPILLIMAAFAVNVAYMDLTNTELRVATDFASRAGARRLSMTGDTDAAFLEVQEAASRNLVAGQGLVVDAGDVEFGRASRDVSGEFIYTTTMTNPNAVRLTGNRTGTGNAVPMLFTAFASQATYEPSKVSTAAQIDRDIALVIDRSGSMAERTEGGMGTGWMPGDPAPSNSRWVKVVEATDAFLAALAQTPMQENVSLVTYNHAAGVNFGLTGTYSDIENQLDAYTASFEGGATNIADGIAKGAYTLADMGQQRPWASQTVVVLTDGIHNTGTITPEDAATAAAAQGMIVHTITFGNDANQTAMQAVAANGNGQHWHAPNLTQLNKIFNEIANNCPTLLIE